MTPRAIPAEELIYLTFCYPGYLRYNLNMELLAPAGTLEKLIAAVRFGADAVYCGAGSFSLRAPDAAFSLKDLAEGICFAHKHDCRVYLALNIFAFDEDFDEMIAYYRKAVELGIDAVIVSDPGVILRIRSLNTGVKIHLSTQANTTNSESVRFWREQGVGRINLARELSLSQIGSIREKVPGMELEILVHGAMCIAYSGRCLLSGVLSNRLANRGDCTQPCRWQYHIRESGRKESQTVYEDVRGTYILNSRDLCMIEHIPELAAAGIDSIKIEGRMKTAYYVAVVTRVYRAALDSFQKNGPAYKFNPLWLEELNRVSHRPYTSGFYLPAKKDETEYLIDSSPIGGHDFVGTVDQHNLESNSLRIKVRNRIASNDTLEILDYKNPMIDEFRVAQIIDAQTGRSLKEAHNSYIVMVVPADKLQCKISKDALLRKKSTDTG
jgi:U32 family peptidase